MGNSRQFLLFTLCSTLLITQIHAQRGNIRGTITDEQGNPIEEVLIRIQSMGVPRNYQTKTDSKGQFFHAGLSQAEVYRVIAQKEGYQSAYVEGLRPSPGRDTEQGLADFTLSEGPAGRLAFELTDEEIEQLREDAAEAERRQQNAAEVRANLDQGLQLYGQGEYAQALEVFDTAIGLDDKQPALWANLGNTYSKLNQDEQALEAYQTAINLAPDDPTLYQNLGGIYASMGDMEKAQELYEKAVSLSAYGDPKDAAANYYNMGVTLINSGKTPEAIDALRKAIEADPSYAEAHYQLGVCLLGVNEMEASLEHFKEYLELVPEGANAEVAKALIDQLGQ